MKTDQVSLKLIDQMFAKKKLCLANVACACFGYFCVESVLQRFPPAPSHDLLYRRCIFVAVLKEGDIEMVEKERGRERD